MPKTARNGAARTTHATLRQHPDPWKRKKAGMHHPDSDVLKLVNKDRQRKVHCYKTGRQDNLEKHSEGSVRRSRRPWQETS